MIDATTMTIRYTHTNLIARDWRSLAEFYMRVFGCTPVGPQRDLSGDWLDRATGIPGAHLSGVHLRLPGCGEEGPTLEIFSYDSIERRLAPAPNATGFGHLAFHVDDVAGVLAEVIGNGGAAVGELVDVEVAGVGRLSFVYARDPEGNILELQRWNWPRL